MYILSNAARKAQNRKLVPLIFKDGVIKISGGGGGGGGGGCKDSKDDNDAGRGQDPHV